ncbi:MAG: GNAT family N-acetyltransferase, partial [Gammaproteobacteria bacterium]|nr:GNAT family N-acetyltransferase [Gammaproteobacteria bacterium]
MSSDFSQIKNYLSQEKNFSLPRQVVVLAGNDGWLINSVQEIIQSHDSDALIVTDKITGLENNHLIGFKHVQYWLGHEKKIVVFDATETFNADAFAAISGIVTGGGLFIILMPPVKTWTDIYHSRFGSRFILSLEQFTQKTLIHETGESVNYVPQNIHNDGLHNANQLFITRDQKNVVEFIVKEISTNALNPIVLISDRGRGKSAALGMSAAMLVKAKITKIIVTAPRMRATDILFKHLAAMLPGAEVSRGSIHYAGSIIQFYPPDQLIHEQVDAELLFIDEAAAIPVPMLQNFLHKYPQCIFATTVHGYEGTGRGFALRFNKILDTDKPGWHKLQMQTPVRWAENDPLEAWMFKLLCLDAEVSVLNNIDEIDFSKIDYSLIEQEQLVKNELLLNQVFSLLVLAHYKTQPNDLINLLDDESLSLYVAIYGNNVIAVALVIREGKFPASLSTSIYRGERRPQGHLLAQALTYHCGIERAATLDYARVMRIAVHPELQNHGIGTRLLKYIINNETKNGRAAIGTSFGLNKSLLCFWKKLGFTVVRIGFTREQTSGEHACIMLLPLNNLGEEINRHASQRFTEQLPYWIDDVLNDLSEEIKSSFNANKPQSLNLNDEEKNDIASYIKYSRNFELCISAVTKFVLQYEKLIEQSHFPESYREILFDKIIRKKSWQALGKDSALKGKSAARKYFYQ